MMKSEFESLAGRNVTDEQYKAIETLYMSSNLEKAEFVKSIRTMLKSIPQPEKKKDIKRMAVRDRSGYRKTPNGCYYHVTLLNHEFTVIDDERLKVYREEGWELHENMAAADAGMNTELIEKGRALCEEERETIWAMQLDGLTETQACEEYFLTKHTEYNNFSICYIPNKEVFAECVAVFGERY